MDETSVDLPSVIYIEQTQAPFFSKDIGSMPLILRSQDLYRAKFKDAGNINGCLIMDQTAHLSQLSGVSHFRYPL
jgi:hypothetical protein